MDQTLAQYTCQLAIYTAQLPAFTKWLVIVTGGLVFIGIWQAINLRSSVSVADRAANEARDAIAAAQISADAAIRLANTADITAKRQLRAYISVKKFSKSAMVDPHTQKVVGWELQVMWQNTGTTPTRDMLSHMSGRFEKDEISDGFRFPDTFIIGRRQGYVPEFLAPQAKFVGGYVSFSLAQLQQVKSGRMTLYLYGWADYNDVFPDTPRHRTEYCTGVLIPGEPDLNSEGNIAFELYWKHNGADEECMRQPSTTVQRDRILPLPAVS